VKGAVPAENLPALQRLAQAVGGPRRLRGQLSKYRKLDIVCAEHDKRMAQVIRTPSGDVLLARTRMVVGADHDGNQIDQPTGEIDGAHARQDFDVNVTLRAETGRLVGLVLADLDLTDAQNGEGFVPLTTYARCGRYDLYPGEVMALLEQGKTRVRVSHSAE
jgi:hypothetical protein